MTLKIYHDDSYPQEFSANIFKYDLENHGFILDRTAFYPGGGGQPNDKGSIVSPSGSTPILKVKLWMAR